MERFSSGVETEAILQLVFLCDVSESGLTDGEKEKVR